MKKTHYLASIKFIFDKNCCNDKQIPNIVLWVYVIGFDNPIKW